MRTTKTVETVEEFDKEGLLLRRTVTETERTDDNPARYTHSSVPCAPSYYILGPGGPAYKRTRQWPSR